VDLASLTQSISGEIVDDAEQVYKLKDNHIKVSQEQSASPAAKPDKRKNLHSKGFLRKTTRKVAHFVRNAGGATRKLSGAYIGKSDLSLQGRVASLHILRRETAHTRQKASNIARFFKKKLA
jgi:hypothetical protein